MRLSATLRWLWWLLACVSLLSLTACATMDDWLHHRFDSQQQQGMTDNRRLQDYLLLMQSLTQADQTRQQAIFNGIESTVARAPSASNELKFALALGTPGHPNSDPKRAAQQLRRLLATADTTLRPEEKTLAAVYLAQIEQRLTLNAAAKQARQEAASKLADRKAENRKRLQAAAARNKQLSKKLKEAEQKLTAITNIERSIRERENAIESDQVIPQPPASPSRQDTTGRR